MGAYPITLSHCVWTVAPCLGSTSPCLLSQHGNHSPRGLSHLLCLVLHSQSLWIIMNLWDKALWEVWQNVMWELAFELEHQGFYSWLLHGQAVSLKVYIQQTWTWITLTTFSSFSCLKLYYMLLYSSAHGHKIGFLLALDRRNIDVFHRRRRVTFCRFLAQTDEKRTSSVRRDEL